MAMHEWRGEQGSSGEPRPARNAQDKQDSDPNTSDSASNRSEDSRSDLTAGGAGFSFVPSPPGAFHGSPAHGPTVTLFWTAPEEEVADLRRRGLLIEGDFTSLALEDLPTSLGETVTISLMAAEGPASSFDPHNNEDKPPSTGLRR